MPGAAVVGDATDSAEGGGDGGGAGTNGQLPTGADKEHIGGGLNFTVHPHSCVAIIDGASQPCSSSSSALLVDALVRFVEPTSGCIFINGFTNTSVGVEALRQSVAIAPRQCTLFRGCVGANLDPLHRHSTPELEAALSMVGLGMLAGQLDVDMRLFSGAMSAGQCWLVGVARVLLRVRRQWVQVAVIDTPSWSLDEKTHDQLLALLRPDSPLRMGPSEEEGEGVTTFLVTSRLQTAIAADSVVVLGISQSDQDGYCEPVVAEQGTPGELLCEEGEFSRLVRESGEEHQLMEAVAESGMAGDDAIDCEL